MIFVLDVNLREIRYKLNALKRPPLPPAVGRNVTRRGPHVSTKTTEDPVIPTDRLSVTCRGEAAFPRPVCLSGGESTAAAVESTPMWWRQSSVGQCREVCTADQPRRPAPRSVPARPSAPPARRGVQPPTSPVQSSRESSTPTAVRFTGIRWRFEQHRRGHIRLHTSRRRSPRA